MTTFAPYDRVLLTVPSRIPMPFCMYDPAWLELMVFLDGGKVTLARPRTLGVNSHGWDFDAVIINANSRFDAAPRWVPTDWISEMVMDKASSRISCNCPLNTILITGCKDPLHD